MHGVEEQRVVHFGMVRHRSHLPHLHDAQDRKHIDSRRFTPGRKLCVTSKAEFCLFLLILHLLTGIRSGRQHFVRFQKGIVFWSGRHCRITARSARTSPFDLKRRVGCPHNSSDRPHYRSDFIPISQILNLSSFFLHTFK